MDCHRFRLSPYLLAGLLATVSIQPAFSIEADTTGERLKELLQLQQLELNYSDAQLNGNEVTLEGVTIKSAAGDENLPLGDLVLEDVVEEPDGTYRVGTMVMDSFEHQKGDLTISMIDLEISGLVLPENPASDTFGGAMRYDRMALARLDVENMDGPVASFGNMYADMNVAEGNTLEMVGGAESFSIDLASAMDDNNASAVLDEMGYSDITGSALMNGSWRPSDGRMTLSRYEAAIDDAGSLVLSLDFSGYTPQFIRTMEETVKNMEQQGAGGNSSMQGMAMLGLMQQLTFHGASIRFNDDSLAEKALKRVADKENKSQDEIINEAKSGISQQFSPFLGSDLANSMSEAVGTFLNNPENIEISAQPANPVPFALLMGAAMGAPEMLVKQLGLSVKANQ